MSSRPGNSWARVASSIASNATFRTAAGKDADPHADARRARQHRGGLRDPTAEGQVFDDPELVESEVLHQPGEVEDPGGVEVARKHDAVGGGGHGSPCGVW